MNFETFPTSLPEEEMPPKAILESNLQETAQPPTKGAETSPTPETVPMIHEESSATTNQTEEGQIASQEKAVEEPWTPEEKAWSDHVDEVLREETEKLLPEKLRKARRGLGDLFDLLPHDQKPKEEDIVNLVDRTELEELLPWWRKKLAEEIRQESLTQKPKAEFIAGGMKILAAWARTEAMNDASSATLARLHEDREMRPVRP